MLGINQIYLGDCLEVMQSIDDNSIDIILCDLPYGTTACKWDCIIPFEPLWKEYKRISKPKSAIVLFGQEPFSSKLRCSNLEMYRYDWVWEKQKPSNFQLMNYQCGRITENIIVFSKAKACYTHNNNSMNYYPIMNPRQNNREGIVKIYGNTSHNILHDYSNKGIYKNYTEKHPINILKFNSCGNGKLHPTQKPLELCEYLIKTYSNEGDLVLDNCCGSGTTCLAAKNLERNYIGIEKDENYFKIATERLNNA